MESIFMSIILVENQVVHKLLDFDKKRNNGMYSVFKKVTYFKKNRNNEYKIYI